MSPLARTGDPATLKQMAQRVPAPVHRVVRTLVDAGHAAVVVGGAVRDMVLEVVPGDFDVATSATPEEVMAVFPRTVPTGLQHGTVTVVEPHVDVRHEAVEVTTFRTEGGYQDGRRPDHVAFVRELDEDLSRRDFTINAMALHLHPTPTLADPFGGVADLEAGLLRTVGNPDARFQEDGLRAVRAARFAAQLNLRAVDGLEDAMARALPVVQKVAAERFLQELRKLFEKAPSPSLGLRMMARTGLLAWMTPQAPVDLRSLDRPDQVPSKAPEARWAAWLWDGGRDTARKTLQRLKASAALQEDVGALCQAPRPEALAVATDAQLRQWVRKVGRARVPWLGALWATEGGNAVVERVEAVLAAGYLDGPHQLALDGHALQALTGAQGKALGELTRALLATLDQTPELNTPDALAALARSLCP